MIIKKYRSYIILLGLLTVFLAGFVISFTSGAARQTQKLSSQAASGPATLSFSTETATDGKTVLVLRTTTTENIAFAEIYLNFDKNGLQLAEEFTTTSLLATVNSKTTKSQANASGQIMLSLALTPANRASPPHGTFEIARFRFITGNGGNQTVTIDGVKSYLVNLSAASIPVNSVNITIGATLQPTSSVSPTGQPGGPGVIPNPPPWWSQIPQKLKDFIELIYIWVFYFHRTAEFQYLLDGIVPTPTP